MDMHPIEVQWRFMIMAAEAVITGLPNHKRMTKRACDPVDALLKESENWHRPHSYISDGKFRITAGGKGGYNSQMYTIYETGTYEDVIAEAKRDLATCLHKCDHLALERLHDLRYKSLETEILAIRDRARDIVSPLDEYSAVTFITSEKYPLLFKG